MKKRIVSLIIALSFLLTSFGIVANADTTEPNIIYSIEREIIGNDILQRINIKGIMPNLAGEFVKFVCYKTNSSSELTDSEIKGIGQTIVDKDGNFNMMFGLTDDGNYVIEVNSLKMDTAVKFEDIEIKAKTFYDGIIEDFKDLSQSIITLIEQNKTDLNLNTKFYDYLSDKSGVEKVLSAQRGDIKITNINSLFEAAAIKENLRINSNLEQLKEILATYEAEYFNLKTQANAKNIYTTFSNFSAPLQNEVVKLTGGTTYDDLAKVKDKFNESVIIVGLNRGTKVGFSKILVDNEDYTTLADFKGFSDIIKNKVIDYLIDKKTVIKNIGDFKKQYKDAVNASSIKPVPPIGGGTGGGGGGGGGGGTPNINVEVDRGDTELIKPEITSPVSTFSDIDNVVWAKEAILSLNLAGILVGKGDGLFCPNDYVTREEFAKIVTTAFNIVEDGTKCSFSDVKETDWSYKYIASAKKNEIIKGLSDGSFGKNDNVTREDMATIIYRALEILNLGKNVGSISKDKEFADVGSVSEYAKNSVIMLANMNIVSGNENKEFMPQNFATRAEVAVIIRRTLDNLKK